MKEVIINEIQNAGAAKPVSDENWETPEMLIISLNETESDIFNGPDGISGMYS